MSQQCICPWSKEAAVCRALVLNSELLGLKPEQMILITFWKGGVTWL